MKLFFSKKSEKDFEKLNPRIQQKIATILNKFQNNIPIDIKKLQGKTNEFRIRAGNYRIQLQAIKSDFLIAKIAKRENFYSVFLM